MVAIKATFGTGGSGLTPKGQGDPTLAQALRDGIDDVNSIAGASADGVLMGLRAGTPTTASDQLTGAGGNLDWNVDVEAGSCVVNDVEGNFEAEADHDVTSGSAIITDGQSIYAWLVASEAAGTVSKEVVLGTAATTGEQVVPTDAEITTGVGHENWTKLALLLINRTADTTVTQSESVRFQRRLTDPDGTYTLKNTKA